MPEIEARPAVNRESLHPSITVEQIDLLVERFYAEVRNNSRLAPLFADNMSGSWDVHLAKMKGFWRSVLLKTGEYKGRPVPVHLKIKPIDADDFEEWLQLFTQVSNDTFTPDAADAVTHTARRIATSLWLSRITDPHAKMPEWTQTSPAADIHPVK